MIKGKFFALAGCFAAIGTFVLFSAGDSVAQTIGFDLPDAEPVVPYVAPTSVQRRNQLCIEEWQKSYAYQEQYCRGVWVSWDSYTLNPTFFNNVNDEKIHMQYSKCLVNVKCIKGYQAIGIARHKSALPYGDVHEIRRCKEPGTTMNTHCDPLTQQDLSDAVDAYFDALEQQPSGSTPPGSMR